MNSKRKVLKKMIFAAMYAALAIVLDFVKSFIPFTSIWANGGSIDISLIPLAFASFHLGIGWGAATCLVEFVVAALVGVEKLYFAPVNPLLGFLCDYLIPVVVVGLVSFLVNNKKPLDWKICLKMEIGILVCMGVRIFSQIVSGAYCWVDEAAAGNWASWLFSIQYNGSYGLPTLIMLLIIMPILYKVFYKYIVRN